MPHLKTATAAHRPPNQPGIASSPAQALAIIESNAVWRVDFQHLEKEPLNVLLNVPAGLQGEPLVEVGGLVVYWVSSHRLIWKDASKRWTVARPARRRIHKDGTAPAGNWRPTNNSCLC